MTTLTKEQIDKGETVTMNEAMIFQTDSTQRLREQRARYELSLAYVSGRSLRGKLRNATGFHIGAGYFVLPSHVCDLVDMPELVTECCGTSLETDYMNIVHDLTLVQTNFLQHEARNDRCDKAKASYVEPYADTGRDLLLSKVVILGYRPQRILDEFAHAMISVTGEIVGVLEPPETLCSTFVVSACLRHSLVGSPIISEWGGMVGVMGRVKRSKKEGGFVDTNLESLCRLVSGLGDYDSVAGGELGKRWLRPTWRKPEAAASEKKQLRALSSLGIDERIRAAQTNGKPKK